VASDEPQFPPGAFDKWDATDDALFYVQPRFVTHIDDDAIAALTDFYRTALPAGGVILDLMSSGVSHLPPEATYGEVIGHGMNAAELKSNARLTRWFVQDLNQNQSLDIANASVDAVTICVSIQYLQEPVAVLREVARILRPGGIVVIGYSNRCFPTKAVKIWQAFSGPQHGHLISLYLRAAGFAAMETRQLRDGGTSDPFVVVVGRTQP